MPNLVTHSLFALEVLESLNDEALNQRENLVKIGASGPDFLFFHKMPSIAANRQDSLPRIGSKLHREKINEFYTSLAKTINAQRNREVKEDMIAYAIGHLCHWAMDSTLHPYIFYRTGNCKGRSAWRHHRFESLLDCFVLKMKKQTNIAQWNPAYTCANPSLPEQKVIAKLYQPAIFDLYSVDVKKSDIARSLQDWHRMQKVFHDPAGKKQRLAHGFEKLTGTEYLLSGYAIPSAADDNADILNLNHSEWKNPVTGEAYTKSIPDLWDEAKLKALTAITLFLQAAARPDAANLKGLTDYLDNRSYDYGISTSKEPLYFSDRQLEM